MSKSSQIGWPYIAFLSTLSALLVGLLISTTIVKVVFSVLTFLLTFALLLILTSNPKPIIALRTRNSIIFSGLVQYALGLIASILVLTLPNAGMTIDVYSMWGFFTSLPLASITRVFSAFFLACVFPGMVIYSTLMEKCGLNLFERIGLILLLSYCFTCVTGLFLVSFQVFSNLSFNIMLWISVILLAVYKRLKAEDTGPLKNRFFAFDMNSINFMLIGGALVALSYLQVLAIPPFTGIISGDVIGYMVDANRFFALNFARVASPYVWSNIIYFFIASLAGIPMYYVYAGIQFNIIILASAFYFFVRTLFPRHKEVASIAALLCFFGGGLTSFLMVYFMMYSPGFFETYMSGNTGNALGTLLYYVGAPGVTPLSLSSSAFDFGLIFYALAFTYRGLSAKERKVINYLLPAFFASSAFFAHSINILFVFVFTVLLLTLFFPSSRKYLLSILSLMVVFIVLLDPISKWYFSDLIISRTIDLGNQLTLMGPSATNIVLVIAILIVAGFMLFAFYRKKKQSFHGSVFIQDFRRILDRTHVKVLFYVLGFSVLLTSVMLYFLNYEELSYVAIWGLQTYVFPWYYIVFRVYGIVLAFAVASIPFLIKLRKGALVFVSALLFSMLISAMLSLVFPSALSPNIVYTRYTVYIQFVLSILAAFALIGSMKLLRNRRARALRVGLLHERSANRQKCLQVLALVTVALLVSFPILSQAYTRETFLAGSQPALSESIVQAVDWINVNLPSGSSILPLTESSERVLSNFVLGMRVIPNFQYWWLNDALLQSRSEVILYSLMKSGAGYIFATSTDLSGLSFQQSYFYSALLSLPEVYHNDLVTIYSVPQFPIQNESNYILVSPSSDNDRSSVENAYSFLMASGIRFSLIDDTDLLDMRLGSVYFLLGGESIPMASLDVLEHIKQGASVVCTSIKSACQILNMTCPAENGTSARARALYGIKGIDFMNGTILPVNGVSIDKALVPSFGQVTANYILANGSRVPYMVHEKLGNGSLVFMNLISPLYVENIQEYRTIMNFTYNLLRNLLGVAPVGEGTWSLSLPNDLFTNFEFGRFALLSMLQNMNGLLLWYGNVNISGKIGIESDQTYLVDDQLAVDEISVQSSYGNLDLKNLTLYNATFIGKAIMSTVSPNSTVTNSFAGLYCIIRIVDPKNCNITLTNTYVTFSLNNGGTIQGVSLSDANVTLRLDHSSFTARFRQAKLTIDGNLSGTAKYTSIYSNILLHSFPENGVELSGKLGLTIIYCSGIVYSKLVEINELQTTSL